MYPGLEAAIETGLRPMAPIRLTLLAFTLECKAFGQASHSCVPTDSTLDAAACPLVPVANMTVCVLWPATGPGLLHGSADVCWQHLRTALLVKKTAIHFCRGGWQ